MKAKDEESRQETLARLAKAVRRYLPGDEDFGDSLSTGGSKTTQVLGRQVAELEAERPSALRELGLGALQVFRALSGSDERGEVEMAILFTDLVGFSSWALTAGDERSLALLRAVDSQQTPAVEKHAGKVIKRLGDGVMASFYEPGQAAEAALEVSELVSAISLDGYSPKIRAGVHLGAPRRVGGDLIGVDVNIAARVADAAKAGEVLVSEPVREGIADGPYKFKRKTWFRAKGAPTDLRVYSLKRRRG